MWAVRVPKTSQIEVIPFTLSKLLLTLQVQFVSPRLEGQDPGQGEADPPRGIKGIDLEKLYYTNI